MAENTQTDIKKLSFERAMEELESIVKRLEDGKVPLEESVAIYERGESLKRRCEELLRQAGSTRSPPMPRARPPGPSRSTFSKQEHSANSAARRLQGAELTTK
jgi:exodeoxyribonuclease VII small subunit